MPLAVLYRPRAEADLSGIWAYTVEEWSESQAISYLEGLDAAIKLLSEHPEIARERKEFSPPVRIFPHRAHLVIYTFNSNTLEVIRVVHARSNWHSLLSE